MAVIQPDVEQILASLSLLELAAGMTHCRSGAAQASSLTAGVNQHHLDVDSFKTCILVRDFSTTNPSMWHFYIYREIFGDYPLTFVTVAACVRVLFPSSSYVVKLIVKKRRAEAFEVCQLQDPIKYQMHVCPLHNPHKAAILLYNSLRRASPPAHTVCENLGLLVSISHEKAPAFYFFIFSKPGLYH